MKNCLYLFVRIAVRQCSGKRVDRVPNGGKRELCGVKKGLDDRIDESMLRWFGHVERMKSVLVVAQRVGPEEME